MHSTAVDTACRLPRLLLAIDAARDRVSRSLCPDTSLLAVGWLTCEAAKPSIAVAFAVSRGRLVPLCGSVALRARRSWALMLKADPADAPPSPPGALVPRAPSRDGKPDRCADSGRKAARLGGWVCDGDAPASSRCIELLDIRFSTCWIESSSPSSSFPSSSSSSSRTCPSPWADTATPVTASPPSFSPRLSSTVMLIFRANSRRSLCCALAFSPASPACTSRARLSPFSGSVSSAALSSSSPKKRMPPVAAGDLCLANGAEGGDELPDRECLAAPMLACVPYGLYGHMIKGN